MTNDALTPHSSQPPLRARSLTDIVELVPYLLGFHPRDSLVLVALRGARRRVGVTMRVDLSEARRCEELSGSLVAHLRRDGAGEALALVYGGTDDVGHPPTCLPDARLVQALAGGLADAGLNLLDALYVGNHRWWSYACDRVECCPPAGRAIPGARGRTSPAVAAATYAGLVALPSRQALEDTLEASDPVSSQAVERAETAILAVTGGDPGAAVRTGTDAGTRTGTQAGNQTGPPGGAKNGAGARRPGAGSGGRERWRRKVVAEIARTVDQRSAGEPGRLPDEQVARFLVALRDERVRDACCDWVEGARGEGALALWRHLVTRAAPPYDVTPLALVAWSAWHTGAGPLARIAVHRTLDRDPECRLALLLEEALDRGVNPSTVRGRPRGHRRRSGPPARSDRTGPGA